jgi:hypothetical protein
VETVKKTIATVTAYPARGRRGLGKGEEGPVKCWGDEGIERGGGMGGWEKGLRRKILWPYFGFEEAISGGQKPLLFVGLRKSMELDNGHWRISSERGLERHCMRMG